jgi:hypothetical protein
VKVTNPPKNSDREVDENLADDEGEDDIQDGDDGLFVQQNGMPLRGPDMTQIKKTYLASQSKSPSARNDSTNTSRNGGSRSPDASQDALKTLNTLKTTNIALRQAQRELVGYSSQSQPQLDDHSIPSTRQSSPVTGSGLNSSEETDKQNGSEHPASSVGSPPQSQLQLLVSQQSEPNSRAPSLHPSNEQDENEATVKSPSTPSQEEWSRRTPSSGAPMRKRGSQDIVSITLQSDQNKSLIFEQSDDNAANHTPALKKPKSEPAIIIKFKPNHVIEIFDSDDEADNVSSCSP